MRGYFKWNRFKTNLILRMDQRTCDQDLKNVGCYSLSYYGEENKIFCTHSIFILHLLHLPNGSSNVCFTTENGIKRCTNLKTFKL